MEPLLSIVTNEHYISNRSVYTVFWPVHFLEDKVLYSCANMKIFDVIVRECHAIDL